MKDIKLSQNSAFCINISQFDIMENHGILLPVVCMNPVEGFGNAG